MDSRALVDGNNWRALKIAFKKLCYTDTMQEVESCWQKWANFLKERNLEEIAITLLEAGGPLKILAAQMVYAGAPLLETFTPTNKTWLELASLLEDKQHSQNFIAYLRGEVDG